MMAKPPRRSSSARMALCLVLSSPCLQAAEDLADLIAPVLEKHGVPALGCAVIVDGQIAGIGASGVRKRGDDTKVTIADKWHLGSCTKAMTATLLAGEVEDGNVAWSTNMADAFPDLRGKLDEKAGRITVEQLLQHRAGLPAGPSPDLWRRLFSYPGTDPEARTEVALELLAKPPEAEPGTRFLYSNAGYMIAGAVLERIGDKRPWQKRMRNDLFRPLGMKDSGFGPPGNLDSVSQPWGHPAGGGAAVFADNPSSLGPAGTVHATLRDWARFASLHLGNGRPLLTKKRLRELHTPSGDHALGWIITKRPWAPGPILTHAGSNTMWYCVAWLAPEAKFGVLVVCNDGGGEAACDDVAAVCIRRFRGQREP